jgi:hypothetical protein
MRANIVGPPDVATSVKRNGPGGLVNRDRLPARPAWGLEEARAF